LFKPQHGKFQKKGKGKDKKTIAAKKWDGAMPSYMHCKGEGHDEDMLEATCEVETKEIQGKGQQCSRTLDQILVMRH